MRTPLNKRASFGYNIDDDCWYVQHQVDEPGYEIVFHEVDSNEEGRLPSTGERLLKAMVRGVEIEFGGASQEVIDTDIESFFNENREFFNLSNEVRQNAPVLSWADLVVE